MPVSEIISSFIGLGALVVAVLVLRYGSGTQNKKFENSVELALRRFEEMLDKKLSARFDLLVDKNELRLQLELLGTRLSSEVSRLDSAIEQMDDRITEGSEQTKMVINAVLKSKAQ